MQVNQKELVDPYYHLPPAAESNPRGRKVQKVADSSLAVSSSPTTPPAVLAVTQPLSKADHTTTYGVQQFSFLEMRARVQAEKIDSLQTEILAKYKLICEKSKEPDATQFQFVLSMLDNPHFLGILTRDHVQQLLAYALPMSGSIYFDAGTTKFILAYKSKQGELIQTALLPEEAHVEGVSLLKLDGLLKKEPAFKGFSRFSLHRLQTLTIAPKAIDNPEAFAKLLHTTCQAVTKDEIDYYFLPLRSSQRCPYDKLKDFYDDVFAYRKNCVKAPVTEQNPAGYLNASYIQSGGQLFASCQGPMNHRNIQTTEDLWQAIIAHNASTIVALGPSIEGTKYKFDAGFFEEIRRTLPDGTIIEKKIEIAHRDQETYLIERKFRVIQPDKSERLISHIHAPEWIDFGALNPMALKRLITFIKEHSIDLSIPVFVHCSAGIGRTGTLLAAYGIDAVLSQDPHALIEFGAIVIKMRQERYGSIQSVDQMHTLVRFAQSFT